MRLETLGLILIFAGILVILVGVPLALVIHLATTGEGQVSTGGFVWIFPLPPIIFGNVSSLEKNLGSATTLLTALMTVAYILFIVLCILVLLTWLRDKRERVGEGEEITKAPSF